jgi:hypothetical protein
MCDNKPSVFSANQGKNSNSTRRQEIQISLRVGATTLSGLRSVSLISTSFHFSASSSLALVLLCACGGGSSPSAPPNPVPPNPIPAIAALSPTNVASGSPAFTIAAAGSDFVTASTIQWNGEALVTSYVSASQLTAQVPASDVTTAGTASVTVVNPAPGGGASSALSFTIIATNPVPAIAELSPSTIASGSPAFTLTVNGSDFVPASAVNWNGAALTTNYVSASQLTALVPATDVTASGAASVTVVNPAPGGGASSALAFTIVASNPVPAIATLSPTNAAAGSPAFTLTVNGSSFVPASAVKWNGAALATNYVSASQLTALVPAADITTVGAANVTVVNPALGGGASSALAFTIVASNPVPAIATLSPTNAAAGSPAFTLNVNGSSFVAASTVKWNGAALATNYVTASQLAALVPASDLTTAGAANVTVVNPAPGGGASSALAFTIIASNPVPAIATLSPTNAAAGSPAFTLNVNGSSFVPASAVNWNRAALTTNYVSASQLTALVPASDLTAAGTASVTVVNPAPGGGISSALAFTIVASNPVPVIATLSPTNAAAGSPAFTLTVNGSSFVPASAVNWNGAALATNYVSASQLIALVPASDLTTAGAASVTVLNPAPGGGASSAFAFTIVASNPVPAISTLSPTNAAAGSPAFTLTVNGSSFVPASAVNWNGAALTTNYVSASQLTALVPAFDLTAAGAASVTVVNPAPGGGTSSALAFTIVASNPVPVIATLSPTNAAAGSPAFTLTVNGSNFVPSSVVNWNGAVLATNDVSASQLTALVPASDLTTAGAASVTVVNPAPGGGTSGPLSFTINAASSGGSVRQVAQYTAYPGTDSTSWNVTLNNVQTGSTIYVVSTWPNFASNYPTMAVMDGTNTYTQLDRYDDRTTFNSGIQGTQSVGHWYAANVQAGTYTINMAPASPTFEDWVGVVVFEITGVSANPLDGHALVIQSGIPPGTNTVTATVTNTNSSGILIAVTFDDIDATAPTSPLPGSGLTDLGALWDFTKSGKPAARAEYSSVSSPGTHTATFSSQEGGPQSPNYLTLGAIFH